MESENSLDETKTDTIANTQVNNKRRSIVFQRRSLAIVPRDTNQSQNESEELRETEQDRFDLADYVKSLKTERNVWKKTLMERKSERRRLDKQSTFGPDKIDLDLSILPEFEKNYIQSRPNYQKISDKLHNLPDLAVKISVLNATIKHLHEKLEEKIHGDIQNYTKKIIRIADREKLHSQP